MNNAATSCTGLTASMASRCFRGGIDSTWCHRPRPFYLFWSFWSFPCQVQMTLVGVASSWRGKAQWCPIWVLKAGVISEELSYWGRQRFDPSCLFCVAKARERLPAQSEVTSIFLLHLSRQRCDLARLGPPRKPFYLRRGSWPDSRLEWLQHWTTKKVWTLQQELSVNNDLSISNQNNGMHGELVGSHSMWHMRGWSEDDLSCDKVDMPIC